jgi:hypothetical protein
MSKSVFFFLIVLFSGCERVFFRPKSKMSTKQQLINEVRQKAAVQLKKEKNLIPIGTGGQAMNEIVMLAIDFLYYQPVEVENGRKLLIEAVDDFIKVVNAETQIHPYLKNYPFEPKNIEIIIFLKNLDGSQIVPGKLCCLSALNGVLQYEIRDLETGRLTTLYEETYQEAKMRASGNAAGLPELQPRPPRKLPEPHKGLGIGFCS